MMSQRLKQLLRGIYPALLLEDIFPHRARRSFLIFTTISLFIFLLLILFGQGDISKFKGGFSLSLLLLLGLTAFEGYFFSFFSRSNDGAWNLPFEIGKIIFYAEDDDLTKGFIFSDIGDEVLKRLGFSEDEVKAFIRTKPQVTFEKSGIDDGSYISLERYGGILYDHDEAFADFLFTKGIDRKEFVGAIGWVIGRELERIEKERWWAKEHLGTVEGIGKNWAYGETYTLERYGEDITESISLHTSGLEATHKLSTERIETALLRNKGANAVIVSADDSARMDAIYLFARRIRNGKTAKFLRDKRIFVVNSNLLIENAGDKIAFERNFSSLLSEAMAAGNVIVVFPSFAVFSKSASTLGADVFSVLGPYLESPLLHVIILESSENFHAVLESHSEIRDNFEVVTCDVTDESGVISFLTHKIEEIEKETKVYFTFPALLASITLAKERYDSSAYADKAAEIVFDVAIASVRMGKKMISKQDVFKTVSEKTGVPVGTPQGEEKQNLLRLEELLHKRVIGQDAAIKAVSSALRRARAGMKSGSRPIGAFLFLGPTGVGKTETAKSLAHTFFGSEDAMSRLDMSEFRGSDALERLIGSFGGKAGVLAMKVKERPYGVLLLDEFEKTTSEVMNLFLRIFDEGVFSDAGGKSVSVRNNIIIATSNAGSDLIWKIVKEGKPLEAAKESIMEEILQRGTFTPELLNRFDGVILFHPLMKEDLKQVAALSLKKMETSLRERGLRLSLDDALLEFLAEKGSDTEFGARAMRRAIQESVEEMIAAKIISGEASEGSTIGFTKDESGNLKIEVR